MDIKELLDLYKEGEYLKIIGLADDVHDANALFLKLRSLIQMNRNSEAFYFFLNHKESLLDKNFREAISLYVDILVNIDFDEIEILIYVSHFRSWPNQSDEDKLYFKGIRKEIEEKISKKSKQEIFSLTFYSKKEILDMLSCDVPTKVMEAIGYLRTDFIESKGDHEHYAQEIEDILKKRSRFNLCYGLLFDQLAFYRLNYWFSFHKNGLYYQVNPDRYFSQQDKEKDYFAYACNYVYARERDLVVAELCMRLMYLTDVYMIPKILHSKVEAKELILVSYRQALEILGYDPEMANNLEIKRVNKTRLFDLSTILNEVYQEFR